MLIMAATGTVPARLSRQQAWITPGQGRVLPRQSSHMPIAEEEPVRTEQAVVTQCLNYRHPLSPGRIVDGRGDQGEEVLHVHNIWPLLPNETAQLSVTLLAPNRAQ